MILRQIERVRRASSLDALVVATSVDSSDDELVAVLEQQGITCVRGPLEDVLGRFLVVLETRTCDVVVRLTADCPLISPEVIDLVVERFHESAADYVSNTMNPSFPDGLDVEVMSVQVLREVGSESTDPHEREHVTLGIYRHPERFSIENVFDPSGRDNSRLRWTVDTPDDLAFVAEIYAHLGPDAFEYDDVLDLLERRPELSRSEDDAARNAALDGLETGAMQRNEAP
jgi:spore coat polysaccharide biosynthesis protein SpsF